MELESVSQEAIMKQGIAAVCASLLCCLLVFAQGPTAHHRLFVEAGHSKPITEVCSSPDGAYFVSAAEDGSIRVYDATSGRIVQALGPVLGLTAVAVTGAPTMVIAAGGGATDLFSQDRITETRVFVFDAATGATLATKSVGVYKVTAVVLDRSRRCLYVADTGGYLSYYRLQDDQSLRRIPEHFDVNYQKSIITAMRMSVHDDYLVCGDMSGRVTVRKLPTLDPVITRELPVNATPSSPADEWPPDRIITNVALDERTGRLAFGNRHHVMICDTAKGSAILTASARARGRSLDGVALSESGRFVLRPSEREGQELVDIVSGAARKLEPGVGSLGMAAVSPDGTRLVAAWNHHKFVYSLSVMNLSDGQVIAEHVASRRGQRARFSGDGRSIVIDCDDVASLWDLTSGTELRLDTIGYCVLPIPERRSILVGAEDAPIEEYDIVTGEKLRSFEYSHEAEDVVAIQSSAGGEYILATNDDADISVIDRASGKVLRSHESAKAIDGAFSSSGRRYCLAEGSGIVVYETISGERVGAIALESAQIAAVYLDDESERTLLGGIDGTVQAIDKQRRGPTFRCASAVRSMVRHPAGGLILIGTGSGEVCELNYDTLVEVSRFKHHELDVVSAGYSPDGSWIIASSIDGTQTITDGVSKKLGCRLLSLKDGIWVCVDPAGRFDTNSFDRVEHIHWSMREAPLKVVPIEAFTREFFTPALLSKVITRATLPSVPDIASINIAMPRVTQISVAAPAIRGKVIPVRITVESVQQSVIQQGIARELRSGVCDVHLYLDGTLVGRSPARNRRHLASVSKGALELNQKGVAEVVIEVEIPSDVVDAEMELSAYAFSEAGVKGETVRKVVKVASASAPQRKYAYVIGVGVGMNLESGAKLGSAEASVNRFVDSMTKLLSNAGEHNRVRPIKLITGARGEAGTGGHASVANLRALLGGLAGRAQGRREWFGTDPVVASADDTIVVYVCAHSFSAPGLGFGRDYGMVLADTRGLGKAGDAVDASRESIFTADDLADLLEPIRARRVVVVLDGCEAGAAVDNGVFRPAPLGVRGLGQLAFDKRMLVVATASSDEVVLAEDGRPSAFVREWAEIGAKRSGGDRFSVRELARAVNEEILRRNERRSSRLAVFDYLKSDIRLAVEPVRPAAGETGKR